MRYTTFTLLCVAVLLSVFTLPGNAALVGTSVTGSLTFDGDPSNYFDPGYGFVPSSGYLNIDGTTVLVSNSAVEFGFDDGASRITADFFDTQLTLSDLIESSGTNNSFQMIFADPAFAEQSLFPVSDSFPFSYSSIAGNVLTLDYAGSTPIVGQTLTATFNVVPSPEPSSAGIVFISVIAALAFLLARNRRTTTSSGLRGQ